MPEYIVVRLINDTDGTLFYPDCIQKTSTNNYVEIIDNYLLDHHKFFDGNDHIEVYELPNNETGCMYLSDSQLEYCAMGDTSVFSTRNPNDLKKLKVNNSKQLKISS